MKRSLIGIVAIATTALVVTAGAAGGPAARSGALHVTKECSEYHGNVGEFCTITSSNISAIKPGMKVVYLGALAGDLKLDADLVLKSAHGPEALGHVVLDLMAAHGTVTLSGGTGRFANFHADVTVTLGSDALWHWDGSYSFASSATDD
jgi:hypothetical protein